MDNKIVSTTYVPLQPPYQIIKYSGDIAMQIGTLIVTIQKEGNMNGIGYQIETHSHPVVSYENKGMVEKTHQLSHHQFLEGAVWNNVEVKDVSTICLTDSKLPWMEFIDFLWSDLDRRSTCAHPTIAAFWTIDKLSMGIEPLKRDKFEVHLQSCKTERLGKDTPVICSSRNSVLALSTPDIGDDDKIFKELLNQVLNYSTIIRSFPSGMCFDNLPPSPFRSHPPFDTSCVEVNFVNNDARCENIAKMLNQIGPAHYLYFKNCGPI